MAHQSSVAILDFGSQYTQVIARRVREQQVYSEILPHDTPAEVLAADQYTALILSGGPASVIGEQAPRLDPNVLDLNKPILVSATDCRSCFIPLGARSAPMAVENTVRPSWRSGTPGTCSAGWMSALQYG